MDTENKYGTLEVQKELLKLLKEFDAMCVKENIKYSVSSGTLLGAVRHEGFIPWDDDIDVIMLRADYEQLKTIVCKNTSLMMEKELWLDRVRFVQSPHDESIIPSIDIFVLDNTPDSLLKENVKFVVIAFLQGMIKGKPTYEKFSTKEKILSWLAYNVGKVFSLERKNRMYAAVTQWWNTKPSRYLSCWVDRFGALRVKYDSFLFEQTERKAFENIEVNAITQFDRYLTQLYGDYMTPPDEGDRHPKHMSL